MVYIVTGDILNEICKESTSTSTSLSWKCCLVPIILLLEQFSLKPNGWNYHSPLKFNMPEQLIG